MVKPMANRKVQVKGAYVEEHGSEGIYILCCVLLCVAAFCAFVLVLKAWG